MNSEQSTRSIPLDQQDGMSLDERIDAGDREAIYDAIVEAMSELEGVRRDIGTLLVEDADVLDRLAVLKRSRITNGEPPIVRPRRRKQKETAGTDAGGKERQRSRINRSTPASHGR
jgi:hypothetical protein